MGRQLTHDPLIIGQGLYDSSSTQLHPLGTLGTDGNGRYFRYAKAGAVALVRGNVVQGPAQITTHDQLTPAAAAIGAEKITVTLDSTNDATENYYAEGLAVIDTTPGLGQFLPIIGHPLVAASAAGVFSLGTTLEVALTTSSRVTLVPNPYRGVIASPTTLTGPVVGVAIAAIAAGEFGWVAVRGSFGVLIAGTPAVGAAVGVPGSAAGAVVIDGAATSGLYPIGVMQVTGVDGKVLPVMVNLP